MRGDADSQAALCTGAARLNIYAQVSKSITNRPYPEWKTKYGKEIY